MLEWIRKVEFVGAGSTIGRIGVAGSDGSDISDKSDGRCVPWPVNYRTHPGLVYQAILPN